MFFIFTSVCYIITIGVKIIFVSNNINQRFLSGFILLAIIASSIFLGSYYFELMLLIILSLILVEILIISDSFSTKNYFILFISTMITYMYFPNNFWLLYIYPFSVFCALRRSSLHLIFYLIMILFSLAYIKFLFALNIIILFWIIGIVILTDMFGMIFGNLLRGPKLSTLSPNKHWSGVFAGWFISVLFTYILYTFNIIPNFELVILSIFISILAQMGDLYESFLKRQSSLKDVSDLLPGHGGFLDRFDSWIFVFGSFYLASQ